MKEKKYNSHLEKTVVRTTSNGGRYVRPFDIIRSTSGRAVIKSHSSAYISGNVKKSVVASSSGNGDSDE